MMAFNNKVISQEGKYKALFIAQFTKYVNWPDNKTSGTKITILGDTQATDFLIQFNKTKNLNFEIVSTNDWSSISADTDLVFVSNAKSAHLTKILSKFSGKPVLVVTEKDGLAKKGSAINFVVKNSKLAFELNEGAFTKNNLQVAGQLKALAINI